MISLIVAAAENNVIGKDNQIPWKLPDDMKFFREKTEGHPIITGRKNYEAMGRALPNRPNIVVTTQPDYDAPDCIVVPSVHEAIERAEDFEGDEIFVIGGGQIYREALPLADRIYYTKIHANIDGDVTFPEINESEWQEIERVEHPADDRHQFPFTFITLDRIK